MKLAALAVAVIIPGAVFAETQFSKTPRPQTPGPSPTKISAQPVVNDDLLNFELAMAENGYTINKGLESTSKLLNIYEKVVFRRCLFEAYTSLARSGPAEDPVCIDYTSRILKLDPGNVVAFCARDGIDSHICKQASQKQVLKSYNPEREEREEKASLEDVVAARKEGPRIRQETAKLMEKLHLLKYAKVKNPKKNRAEIEDVLENILKLNCARTRTRLEKLTENTVKDSESGSTGSLIPPDDETVEIRRKKPQATPDAFSRMLDQHFKATPEVELPESHRIYEVTTDCERYIRLAFDYYPGFAAAECHKWGFYSWQCISARRAQFRPSTKEARPHSESFDRSGGGFQKF